MHSNTIRLHRTYVQIDFAFTPYTLLQIADDTTQQSIPAKPVEESYAVSDVVKDKKKDKKVCV